MPYKCKIGIQIQQLLWLFIWFGMSYIFLKVAIDIIRRKIWRKSLQWFGRFGKCGGKCLIYLCLQLHKGAQANKVQGGRTVFVRWQHIRHPSSVNTIGILACPEEVPLVPTSLHWLLNRDPSVTHSKLSSYLFNMGIKPMAQWFYIHNSP